MLGLSIIHILNKLLSIFDVESLVSNGGLLAAFLLVYGTTGLFFCFFIPVGAVLFTAGIFFSTGVLDFDLFTFCAFLVLASVLGNLNGFLFCLEAGPLLFKRKDSKFFEKQH